MMTVIVVFSTVSCSQGGKAWRLGSQRECDLDIVAQFGPVDKIEAPDLKTVAVSFKEPYPIFLVHIWRPSWGILSPKYLDTLKPGDKAAAPVGTGPFKWGGRSSDGVVTLEANPDYAWGPETLKNRQAPYIQTVKFRAVTEGSTRLATLESGESLVIDEVSEPDYARVKGDSRFRFVETPRRSHTLGFFMNVGLAPTNDPAVREAVNWSVDRSSIVGKLFFGVHKTAAGPLSEGVWGRLDELDQRYSYDPKKASQILEEAGWKAGADGIRTKDVQRLSLLLVTFRSPWTEMAEAMQAQVREAGIDLQVQKMERGPCLDYVRSYKHHLCASASTSLDPDGILRVVYHSSNRPRHNFANLADPALDALLDEGARQEINSPERRKTYEVAQRRIRELAPFVGIMSQVRVQAMAKQVNDFEMGPDGLSAAKLTSVWLDG